MINTAKKAAIYGKVTFRIYNNGGRLGIQQWDADKNAYVDRPDCVTAAENAFSLTARLREDDAR